MKNLLLLLALLFSILIAKSQCSNFTTNYPTGIFSSPGTGFTYVATDMSGGDYVYFNVSSGCTYEWSLCDSANWDTQLTLWDETGTTSYAYNDDGCGVQSTIFWTSTFTGVVRLLLSQYSCANNTLANAGLKWREFNCPVCGLSGINIFPPIASNCSGQTDTVYFSANGYCPGIVEYQVSDGTNIIQAWSSNPYFYDPIANSQFIVEARCDSCPGIVITDTFQIETIDAPTISGNLSIPTGSSTSITFSGITADYNWWSEENGGILLDTSATLITANLYSTTTFWIHNALSYSSIDNIKITECGLEGFSLSDPSTDYIEISNLNNSSVNTSGWVVAISDSYTNINVVNSILWYLPSSFNACSIAYKTDEPGNNYWGNNIFWNPGVSGFNSWAIIIDDGGNIIDFVAWGWTAAELATFNPTINGFNITLGSEWLGDGCSSNCISSPTATYSIQRVSMNDSNTSNDFTCLMSTLDNLNPGLECEYQLGCSFPVTVTVIGNSSSVINVVTCDSNSYTSPSGNYIWTTSGTYFDTIPNICGGDSLMTINLSFISSTSSFIVDTACVSYISPSGNYIWTTSGTYTDTITNISGCDSIITFDLVIKTVDISVTQNGDTLFANANGASYQWLDCDNSYTAINGATDQTYIADETGNYAVIVYQNDCIDTSSCNYVYIPLPNICFISTNINQQQICIGDAVDLSYIANYQDSFSIVIMNDDFNNMTLGSNWTSSTVPDFTNPCGNDNDGTPHAWMGVSSYPRILTTQGFSVNSNSQICFDINFSQYELGVGPCESPDEPDEGVELQWSINSGNTWNPLVYFCPDGNLYTSYIEGTTNGSYINNGVATTFTDWANYCFSIPNSAYSNNTQFQWFQNLTSGNEFDNWGIDNVRIGLTNSNFTIVWENNNGFYYEGFYPPPQYPDSAGTWIYTLTLTDGVCSYTDTIIVDVIDCYVNVTELQSENNIYIFPNPTTGKIAIKAENIESVKILNMQGKQVYYGKENEIDLSQQAKGIYIIKVTTERGVAIEKLILN